MANKKSDRFSLYPLDPEMVLRKLLTTTPPQKKKRRKKAKSKPRKAK